MRLTREFIEKTFYEWASKNTQYPVIFADQSGVAPNETYVTLKIITGPVQIGSTDELIPAGGDDFDVAGLRQITLSVNVFGCGAFDILNDLKMSFSYPDVQAFFNAKNIGIVSEGTPNDLTALLETTYQERAQMDVSFYAVDVRRVKVGTIEKVHVTGELDGANETVTTDQTVEAP